MYTTETISKYGLLFIVVSVAAILMLAAGFGLAIFNPSMLESVGSENVIIYMIIYMGLMAFTMFLSSRMVYCKKCKNKIKVYNTSMNITILDGLVENGSIKQPFMYEYKKKKGNPEWIIHIHECKLCSVKNVVSAQPKNWG